MAKEVIATSMYSSKLHGFIVHMNDVNQDYFVSESILAEFGGSRLEAAKSRKSFLIPKD